MFVNAIMYYKVANAIHAVANVDDYSGSARQERRILSLRLMFTLFLLQTPGCDHTA